MVCFEDKYYMAPGEIVDSRLICSGRYYVKAGIILLGGCCLLIVSIAAVALQEARAAAPMRVFGVPITSPFFQFAKRPGPRLPRGTVDLSREIAERHAFSGQLPRDRGYTTAASPEDVDGTQADASTSAGGPHLFSRRHASLAAALGGVIVPALASPWPSRAVGPEWLQKRLADPEEESRLQRGMILPGWHDAKVQVPFAIASSPVSTVLQNPRWPDKWPYKQEDFDRKDKSDDGNFYDKPRFVTHIDDAAIEAIRGFYAAQFAEAPQGDYAVLDLCSSWISHFPKDLRAKRVAITGMNEEELRANGQATEHVAKDLNIDPRLPFENNQFDFITNVVSVDYLARPEEVFTEMHRVMKPGGIAIMSFSNRCFYTKAIKMWVANMNDGPGHSQIVGNYFHFNPVGGWRSISSADISPYPGVSDPMWVVTAVKA